MGTVYIAIDKATKENGCLKVSLILNGFENITSGMPEMTQMLPMLWKVPELSIFQRTRSMPYS